MKNWIFDAVSDLGEDLLTGFQIIASFLISILTDICNNVIRLVAYLFRMTLWLIDRERIDHAQHVVQQMSMNNELQILMNVSKIKEDALDRKLWTSDHSLALNELSSQLYHECDWDKDRIHDYMRAIVESIPGLSYVAADDDEDDDNISLDD